MWNCTANAPRPCAALQTSHQQHGMPPPRPRQTADNGAPSHQATSSSRRCTPKPFNGTSFRLRPGPRCSSPSPKWACGTSTASPWTPGTSSTSSCCTFNFLKTWRAWCLEGRRHRLDLKGVPGPLLQRRKILSIGLRQQVRHSLAPHRFPEEGILHAPRLDDAAVGVHAKKDLARQPRHLLQPLHDKVPLASVMLCAPLPPRLRLVPAAADKNEDAEPKQHEVEPHGHRGHRRSEGDDGDWIRGGAD
mmetsp:Transcript_115531/g.331608  ORF Transcript_115531/g.331608 Transcript_115531/m.331608 type:complete len:247 (-) Transcript_115531:655-1395(-)